MFPLSPHRNNLVNTLEYIVERQELIYTLQLSLVTLHGPILLLSHKVM